MGGGAHTTLCTQGAQLPPPHLQLAHVATPMSHVQVEVAGADAKAEVGGLAQAQRGGSTSPSAAGVVYCFPDPSCYVWAECLARLEQGGCD